MTVFERIETLRKSRHISQAKLEKELGFSNGSISKWKTSMPTPERLQKLSDYFNVSIEYLLSGEDTTAPVLTDKDEKDISKRMKSILEELDSNQEALMFDGEILDDETKELLKNSLKNSLETGKLIAKQKFTPKKYRK